MKIKGDLITRNIAGEIILVPVGELASQFNGIIAVNEAASFIADCMKSETDEESIVKAVCSEFDVSEEEAAGDVHAFVQKLMDLNIISK